MSHPTVAWHRLMTTWCEKRVPIIAYNYYFQNSQRKFFQMFLFTLQECAFRVWKVKTQYTHDAVHEFLLILINIRGFISIITIIEIDGKNFDRSVCVFFVEPSVHVQQCLRWRMFFLSGVIINLLFRQRTTFFWMRTDHSDILEKCAFVCTESSETSKHLVEKRRKTCSGIVLSIFRVY